MWPELNLRFWKSFWSIEQIVFLWHSWITFESFWNVPLKPQTNCGEWSDEVNIYCSVPQGSVLRPLLLLISINDLRVNIFRDSPLYADDTTLVNVSRNTNEFNIVKESLEHANVWFFAGGFVLNEDKILVCTYWLSTYLKESYWLC